jgi:hypothetical protein
VLTRLRAANPVRSEDLAPSIERVWQRLDDPALAERRPPKRRFFPPVARVGVWRRFVIVAAGSMAVVIALLVFGTTGSGPPNAFAGWTAIPAAFSPGETAGALERCTSRLAAAGGAGSGLPARGWRPLLTDTRGPFTAMILRSGGASATCVSGPTFTSIAMNAHPSGGASQHTLSMGTAGATQTAGATPRRSAPSVSVMGLGALGSGRIRTASQIHTSTSGGQRYTIVQGQVGAGVTRVTLVLSNGNKVRATVGGGSFIAWWPGSAAANSARLATGSGASTQRLTFTPVPGPTAPGASLTHSRSFSP